MENISQKFSRFLQSRIFWIQTISISLIALCLVIGLSYAWNAPTQSPPNGNISAPLNVGATTQTKAGGLNLSGKVGIGTTNPGYKLEVTDDMNIKGAGDTDYHIEGRRSIGDYPGWDPNRLYLNAYSDWTSGVTVAGNGGLHVDKNLTVSGNVGIGTINPGAKLEVRGGNINIPVNAISFNAKTNSGTAGMGNTDTGSIYGEHNSGTENSRLVIDVHDNTNDAIVLRSSATSGGSVRDMVYVDNNKVALVKDGGNVGIGTTNPGAKLDVSGNILASQSNFIIDRPNTIGGWARGIMYYPTNTYSGTELGGIGIYGSNTTAQRMYLGFGDDPWGTTAGIQILSNGNVGIGTTNPGSWKLYVNGGNNYTSGVVRADGGFQVDGHQVIDNNAGWHRAYGNAGFYFQNHGGGWYMTDNTWIRSYGNKSIYQNNGTLRTDGTFQVGPSGNRFLVKTNGNVGIGTTVPGYKLTVNGNMYATAYYGDGSHLAGISTGGDNLGNHTATQNLNMNGHNINNAGTVTANAFIYSSDKRLKKDIKNIPNALERILSLRGVSFKWRKNNEQSLGLIAQEVEKVFPELVVTNQTDGMKAVKYGNLVAPLIEAVKEQQKQIDLLKKEIEQLKSSK